MRPVRLLFLSLPASLALGAGLATPLLAQRDPCRDHWGDDDRARVCEVRSLGGHGVRALRIDPGQNGGADVEAWDRDSIDVQAQVLSYARDDDGARELGRQVEVSLSGGVLRATGPAMGQRSGWAVIFKVRVPRQTDLDISTQNGPIDVTGVRGTIALEAQNGPVSLEGVSGDVRARLQNGPLTIELDGTAWQGAGLDASTVNGPLTLRVPRDYNAQLETGTRNGPFQTQIPFTIQANMGRSARMGQDLTTTLGRGGVLLKAKTTNGPLTILSGR